MTHDKQKGHIGGNERAVDGYFDEGGELSGNGGEVEEGAGAKAAIAIP